MTRTTGKRPAFLVFTFALTILLVSVQPNLYVSGWTTPEISKNEKASLSGSSRRNFFAKSLTTATAILGSSTLLPFNAMAATSAATGTTTSDTLVAPNTLNGKTMVVTGGTTGLGLESVKALAKGGATVVLTARSQSKGQKALEAVKEYLDQQSLGGNINNVHVVQLDLDDLENTKSFPQRLQSALGSSSNIKIDVLMNNAGVMAIPNRQLTKDGYERTFQSNHLGHFVLTAALKPYFSDDARIINVSSQAYNFVATKNGLDLDNINSEKEYGPWLSYGQSKLENILFTQELQRRANEAGLSWAVNCLHPGGVNTDLGRNMMGGDEVWFAKKAQGNPSLWERALNAVVTKVLLTPEQGAATQVYLAIADKQGKGQFYDDLKARQLPPFATDVEKAKKLWEISEKLGNVKFAL